MYLARHFRFLVIVLQANDRPLISLSLSLYLSLYLFLYLPLSLSLALSLSLSLGIIYVTFNGLDPSPTWTSRGITTDPVPDLYCVGNGGNNSRYAVAAGTLGSMYKTTDGGEMPHLLFI